MNVTTPRRFVLLQHDVGPGFDRDTQSHWDWMFEIDSAGPLKTFATPIMESFEQPFHGLAETLADHRRHYLDYEGPVSGDRGHVRRLAVGTYQQIESSPRCWEAELVPGTETPVAMRPASIRFAANLDDASLGDANLGDWEFWFRPRESDFATEGG